RRPKPAGLALRAGTHHALLLHRLRQALRAAPQRLQRPALGVDGAVGITLAELAFRLTHGLAGAAELIHLALAEAALAQFLHQLLELIAQALLALAQLAHLVALLPLLTLLTSLPRLAALPALAALVLALLEGAIAQLLLLTDHVAELVERRHHVVVAVHLLPGPRRLQVLEHLLQLLQHSPRRILGAG